MQSLLPAIAANKRPGAHLLSLPMVVPEGVGPNDTFNVHLPTTSLDVLLKCPPNVSPGDRVFLRVTPVDLRPAVLTSGEAGQRDGVGGNVPMSESTLQANEPARLEQRRIRKQRERRRIIVTVPERTQAGPFWCRIEVQGKNLHIHFTDADRPGDEIPIYIPPTQVDSTQSNRVEMAYQSNRDTWVRVIRADDLKYVWTRKKEGHIDVRSRFNMHRSAFVRSLVFFAGNDKRMRTGVLELVPAAEASFDSSCVVSNGRVRKAFGYSDIVAVQSGSFMQKKVWFNSICQEHLGLDKNLGQVMIKVRRDMLLEDSVTAVMSLGRLDLRRAWSFEFLGEGGIDAGGLAREWFSIVTKQVFDPNRGLWLFEAGNQMNMRINPLSSVTCPQDFLIYFRFLGRVIGKALLDQQLLSSRMSLYIYKHILGWPITFDDLELVDKDVHKHLQSVAEMEEEQVEYLCLDFTFTEEILGVKETIELVPDGRNIDVTNENLPEYFEAYLKYHLLGRVKTQLTELLLGIFDVVPEPLLAAFDCGELELLLCGVPVIDVDDWKQNTEYAMCALSHGHSQEVIDWFWDVIGHDFNHEMRARLLHFATGTSGVPSGGFSMLQGSRGEICKFKVNVITDSSDDHFPTAHTCFNEIMIPMYSSRDLLLEKLTKAVTSSATGFGMA